MVLITTLMQGSGDSKHQFHAKGSWLNLFL